MAIVVSACTMPLGLGATPTPTATNTPTPTPTSTPSLTPTRTPTPTKTPDPCPPEQANDWLFQVFESEALYYIMLEKIGVRFSENGEPDFSAVQSTLRRLEIQDQAIDILEDALETARVSDPPTCFEQAKAGLIKALGIWLQFFKDLKENGDFQRSAAQLSAADNYFAQYYDLIERFCTENPHTTYCDIVYPGGISNNG